MDTPFQHSYRDENGFTFHHTRELKNGTFRIRPAEAHDTIEFLYFVEGRAEMQIEGKRILMKDGDLLIIKYGEVHKQIVDLHYNYERFALQLNRNLFPKSSQDFDALFDAVVQGKQLWTQAELSETKIPAIYQDIAEILAANPISYPLVLAKIIEILVEIEKIGAPMHEIGEGIISRPIIEARNYINSHLESSLSLGTVAKMVGLSPDYLSKLFKKELNINFKEYLLIKKMHYARRLLDSGFHIIRIQCA